MSGPPIEQTHCFKVTVGFKDMDMSAGDAIDGPRWSGKWLDRECVVTVVAPTAELAGAGACASFYQSSKAAVKSIEHLCQVHHVVTAK